MRTALNLLITTGLLFLFNAFGWLTLSHDGSHVDFFTQPTLTIFGSVLLIAVVMWFASVVIGLLYGLSVLLTVGLMCSPTRSLGGSYSR